MSDTNIATQRMKEQRMLNESKTKMKEQEKTKMSYNPIDIYLCPRIVNGEGLIQRKSLVYYLPKVERNNASKNYEQQILDPNSYRKLESTDGMIAQFKELGTSIRQIKLLICICMYNESKHAINLTLRGIYQNLQHFEQAGINPNEIGVVLLQDGILKLVENKNKRTYAKGNASAVNFFRDLDLKEGKKKCALESRINLILDQIESYKRLGQESFVKKNRDFPPSIEKNIALLYQNLWKPSMTEYGKQTGMPQYQSQRYAQQKEKYNLRLFTCFKHLNGSKLSSHLWFFQGFCRYLKPQFVTLLDVGTKPDSNGLLNLIRGFTDPWVGGVTGLMSVDANFPSEEGADDKEQEESCWQNNWFMKNVFSIEKAQEYEYIVSHFLDKNAQGILGFLHVLPGAWSAYRYRALVKSEEHQLDLLSRSYFKTVLNPDAEEKDHEEANMYLAQDRILSLGIYCQWDSKYYLKYVPDAIAKTDPMKTHQNLTKQRRRWINSSMYALFYVLRNFHFNVNESRHNALNKYVLLNVSMLLGLLGFINTYISPSVYFYVLYISINQIAPNNSGVTTLAKVAGLLFILGYLVTIAGGLTGATWSKHSKNISAMLSIFFFALWGLVTYNVLVLYIGVGTNTLNVDTIVGKIFIVISILNLSFYVLIIVIHLFTHPEYVLKMLKDWLSYTAYQGAYTITMIAHAFCNIDDVSWGTKGAIAPTGEKKYEIQKVYFVGFWLFFNSVLAYVLIYIDLVLPNIQGATVQQGLVLLIIGLYSTLVLALKTILAIIHHFKWIFTRCCESNWINLTPQQTVNRSNKVRDFWNKTEIEFNDSHNKIQ